jgi:hypothetical protein
MDFCQKEKTLKKNASNRLLTISNTNIIKLFVTMFDVMFREGCRPPNSSSTITTTMVMMIMMVIDSSFTYLNMIYSKIYHKERNE